MEKPHLVPIQYIHIIGHKMRIGHGGHECLSYLGPRVLREEGVALLPLTTLDVFLGLLGNLWILGTDCHSLSAKNIYLCACVYEYWIVYGRFSAIHI